MQGMLCSIRHRWGVHTPDAIYKLDNNNKNVLQDALQYNYNSYDYDGEINQPYLYSLYDTYDEERS